MKKRNLLFIYFVSGLLLPLSNIAQCSMCTKTAQQLGEKPALGLNNAILYLMLAPFAVMGFIAWKWWKGERKNN